MAWQFDKIYHNSLTVKLTPTKVKLLYLTPLALQFDEFFPMINGFLKSVGVLIEVYTMLLLGEISAYSVWKLLKKSKKSHFMEFLWQFNILTGDFFGGNFQALWHCEVSRKESFLGIFSMFLWSVWKPGRTDRRSWWIRDDNSDKNRAKKCSKEQKKTSMMLPLDFFFVNTILGLKLITWAFLSEVWIMTP